MTGYEHKHLVPENLNATRAYCGTSIMPRDIPEMSGVCPTCHEVLMGIHRERELASVGDMNFVLGVVAAFGAGLNGYADGLKSADDNDVKVVSIKNQWQSCWDRISDFVSTLNDGRNDG